MNIFLGSSSSIKSLDDLREIAMLIEDEGHTPIPWNKAGVFPLGNYVAESLRNICKQVDAAILIFHEDDLVWYQNDYALKPRDNVVYEYGLFEGHLGPKRTIICKRGKSKVPSDLQGIIYCDLDKKYRAQLELLEWMRFLDSTNKSHKQV